MESLVGTVSHAIGTVNTARAIGHANRCNPLPLIIPCHRIIAKNGISGYFGKNTDLKRFLLDLEKNNME